MTDDNRWVHIENMFTILVVGAVIIAFMLNGCQCGCKDVNKPVTSIEESK